MVLQIRIVALIATIVSLTASPSPAQPSLLERTNPGESLRSIKDRLKAEAVRTKTTAVSPLLTAIPDLAADPGFRLQDGQIQLCRRLETLARDLVRSWLLRGLDREPPPEAGELEARLSDRGVKLREAIYSHIDEMVLRGVLTPEQSHRWLKTSGVKPRPPLRGRVRINPGNIPPDRHSLDDLQSELRTLAKSFPRSGPVFEIILGQFWVDSEFPDGLDQVDPKVLEKIDDGNLPEVDLEPDQRRLAQRLDELTKDIVAAWMVRGLGDKPAPSRLAMVDRIVHAPLVVDTLGAHAEAIALKGILKSDQADRCLAILWIRLGVQSLLDPAVSAQLKLTRSQREQIEFMIAAKEKSRREIGEATTPLLLNRYDVPGLDASLEVLNQEVHEQMRRADATIFNLLTPSQSRRLEQLIAPANPKTKKKVSR